MVVENGTFLPIMHDNWFSWTRRKEGDDGNSAGVMATDEQVEGDFYVHEECDKKVGLVRYRVSRRK